MRTETAPLQFTWFVIETRERIGSRLMSIAQEYMLSVIENFEAVENFATLGIPKFVMASTRFMEEAANVIKTLFGDNFKHNPARIQIGLNKLVFYSRQRLCRPTEIV